jgi:predicted O-linked N-acetylglucosamine transferase (SPINDLY family)
MGAWCRILGRVPGSTLQLQSLTPGPWVTYLRVDLLRAENITTNMLEWWRTQCPTVSPQQLLWHVAISNRTAYLQHLRDTCDVWLDTPMYNSGVTGVEALAVGVPMVSVSLGSKFMQRAGGSVLRAAGLDALLGTDLAHYERIAIRLMLDPEFWRSINSVDLRATLLFQPSKSMDAFFRGIAVAHDSSLMGREREL